MYEYGIKYCKILVWFSDSSSCAANLPGVRTTLGHSPNFRSKLTKILLLFNKAPIRSTLLHLEQIPPTPLDNDTQYSIHGATPNCSDVSDDNSAECCFSYSCDIDKSHKTTCTCISISLYIAEATVCAVHVEYGHGTPHYHGRDGVALQWFDCHALGYVN